MKEIWKEFQVHIPINHYEIIFDDGVNCSWKSLFLALSIELFGKIGTQRDWNSLMILTDILMETINFRSDYLNLQFYHSLIQNIMQKDAMRPELDYSGFLLYLNHFYFSLKCKKIQNLKTGRDFLQLFTSQIEITDSCQSVWDKIFMLLKTADCQELLNKSVLQSVIALINNEDIRNGLFTERRLIELIEYIQTHYSSNYDPARYIELFYRMSDVYLQCVTENPGTYLNWNEISEFTLAQFCNKLCKEECTEIEVNEQFLKNFGNFDFEGFSQVDLESDVKGMFSSLMILKFSLEKNLQKIVASNLTLIISYLNGDYIKDSDSSFVIMFLYNLSQILLWQFDKLSKFPENHQSLYKIVRSLLRRSYNKKIITIDEQNSIFSRLFQLIYQNISKLGSEFASSRIFQKYLLFSLNDAAFPIFELIVFQSLPTEIFIESRLKSAIASGINWSEIFEVPYIRFLNDALPDEMFKVGERISALNPNNLSMLDLKPDSTPKGMISFKGKIISFLTIFKKGLHKNGKRILQNLVSILVKRIEKLTNSQNEVEKRILKNQLRQVFKLLKCLFEWYPEITPFVFDIYIKPNLKLSNWKGGYFLKFLLEIAIDIDPIAYLILEVPFEKKNYPLVYISDEGEGVLLQEYISSEIIKLCFESIRENNFVAKSSISGFLSRIEASLTVRVLYLIPNLINQILEISERKITNWSARILILALTNNINFSQVPVLEKQLDLELYFEEENYNKPLNLSEEYIDGLFTKNVLSSISNVRFYNECASDLSITFFSYISEESSLIEFLTEKPAQIRDQSEEDMLEIQEQKDFQNDSLEDILSLSKENLNRLKFSLKSNKTNIDGSISEIIADIRRRKIQDILNHKIQFLDFSVWSDFDRSKFEEYLNILSP